MVDRSRARKRWRGLSFLAVGLSLTLLVAAGGGYVYLRYRYDQIHKLSVGSLATAAGSNSPQVFLLIGNNSRAALNGKQASQFGSAAQVGGARSDVTLLLRLDPGNRTASLLSIPRDLFMPIPGTNRANRVDDALNVGPTELIRTIEDDLGIPINHFIELNFDTFQNVVNALGGVNMYFPNPVYDAYSGLNVTTTGCLHLNGTQALQVVRARHMYYFVNGVRYYDGLGDLSRIHRDHEFLRVLAKAVESKGVGNPFTANAVIGAVAPQLQADSGLSLGLLIHLVETFHAVNPANIPSMTLPVAYANNFFYNGGSYGDVVMPVQPLDAQVIRQFLGREAPVLQQQTSAVTVSVENGSGLPGQAAQIANELHSYGYTITSVGNTRVLSTPAETIVYYAPGHRAAGEQVLSQLGGEAILGQRTLPAGTDVMVDTGTTIVVHAPVATGPVAATSSSPAPRTTAGSHSVAPTATPSTSASSSTGSTSATGGVTAVEPPSQPLPSYDPRACPPGSPVKNAS